MKVGMVAKRYAKALYGYAKEQKAEDAVYSEMKRLAEAFAHVPQLRMAMDNPTLVEKDKEALLAAAVGNTTSDVYTRFLKLVLSQRRESYLQSIALSYKDIYSEDKRINTGLLVTASEVDEAVKSRMKLLLSRMKPGTLEFETRVDPEIGGGFMLYVDTYRLDASMKTQLKRIKNSLIAENSKRG